MSEKSSYPSEKLERFIVRMPEGMRDRIRLAAEANNRSMNSEIIAALEEKFPPPAGDLKTKLYELLRRVESDDPVEREEGLKELTKIAGVFG